MSILAGESIPSLMKFSLRILCILSLVSSVADAVAEDPEWVSYVGVRKLDIPDKLFNVADYGAIPDGTTLNTAAIQAAIDASAAQGGGIVIFNKGKYLTGSLYLKSGVQLQVDEGVELLGSQNLADYPEIPTRVAGIEMMWPSALINILHQKNAAVTGGGVIDGQGKPFWDAYWALRDDYDRKKLRWIVDYDAKRPRTLLVDGCWDILIEDVTFKRAGFWTVHILYSSYVTVDGITIRNNIGGHGPSTDGIDIDSSSWILIQNADIDCNDDNFCLKAGRDWDGLRVNRPTEYVLVQHCVSRNGAGLITFGSETSGSMRHIIARHLKALGTRTGIRFKSATTRGGVVEDVHFEHITMDSVGIALEITSNWYPSYSYASLPKHYSIHEVPDYWVTILEPVVPKERGIPVFRDISISHLTAKNIQQAFHAEGLKERPLQRFFFENIYIGASEAGSIKYAEDWDFHGVTIDAKRRRKIQIKQSKNVAL
ncbi:Glycosyl hydrolases family 28 [Parapedobacter indicus]|uniref:Glycosyl hydrolases family 28 n=2 Tax=Parapedobacter indicus TaxID=1477437 RepID=A0A1I3CSD9_9SPHI|nr:glycosyl hydrolase family 28 [Parapedobacter indicus]SFH77420.1 Glycosyl hydrolases family 28 [Parapedobacter indicus]